MKIYSCFLSLSMLITMPLLGNTAEIYEITFPGNQCVEHRDKTPETYYIGGMAYNDANGTNVFVCPIVFPASISDRYDFIEWQAVVDNKTHSENIRCYVQTCNHTKTWCLNTQSSSVGGYPDKYIINNNSNLNHGSGKFFRFLTCHVPGKTAGNGKRSGIVSYTIQAF